MTLLVPTVGVIVFMLGMIFKSINDDNDKKQPFPILLSVAGLITFIIGMILSFE